MKKEMIKAGLGLLILIIGGAMMIIQRYIKIEDIGTISLSSKIISLESKIAEHTERLENCEEFSLFKQAAIKVGSRVWNENNYDCVDFSIDLVEELERKGIKSSIAIEKERTHAWVLIWVEATTGEFVSIEETELEILEIRDGKMEIICN